MASKEGRLLAKKGEEGDLKSIQIAANKGGKRTDIALLVTQFHYYESILDNTIRAKIRYNDTGNDLNTEGLSVVDGLPIVGTEYVNLIFEDANEEKIEVQMLIDRADPLGESTQTNTVDLSLVTIEHYRNEDGRTRVGQRFDGTLSTHIKKILTDEKYLATQKKCEIEPTKNSYNCYGKNIKPFQTCTWLQQKCVPDNKEATNSAGYFLWETSKGFHFKSVDALMAQKPKKKFIYNNIQDERGKNIPLDYDGQILELLGNNNIDVQSKLELGSYTTRIILFDPFNCKYEIIKPTVKKPAGGKGKDKKMEPKLAGKELPSDVFNDAVDLDFTRTTYMLWDSGTLPTGNTAQQIEKSREHNLKPEDYLNQSKMRYNQMFTIKRTITIPGDFTLHAGDAIFIDIPEVSDKDNQVVNQQIGGLYIIVDLCHYMSGHPPACYTKLNLVRDSYKRKPT